MSELMSSFLFTPGWAFITMGSVLLIVELLGVGGYALWCGISAIIVGLVALILPFIPWPALWILFAIFALVTVYLWSLWLKKRHQDVSDATELNVPQNELLGVRTVIIESIINGHGRVKIKDGSWRATCHEDLPLGTKVKVVGVDGLVLTVEKIH
ncbi:NfeD family protein [Utexia brackfieldae]|uniref:NfeD family protein n=1 Tax=Utexia brackfieldae TaxID=3074108 RepID=UPI00370D9313